MINILNELSSVLNIPNIVRYRDRPSKNINHDHGWFNITDITRLVYVENRVFGTYYCIEIIYPNKDELKFTIYKNKIKMQVRKGYINPFKFSKVQHCEFTPNLTEDMYHQYMFIEDHWEITPQEYKVLNTIYDRMEQYISEEPL